MVFPESKRYIYKKNLLDNVICQFRFPTILKIDTELPSLFQESIRKEYPIYNQVNDGSATIPPEIEAQFPKELLQAFGPPQRNINHSFTSENGIYKINLTNSFFSFSVTKYIRWEDFCEKLSTPFDAFKNIYMPAFFTRIGLRYINKIEKSKLGLKDQPWNELLQPYISSMLSKGAIDEKYVLNSRHRVELNLGDIPGQVRIVHGLYKQTDNEEAFYLIDSDFFLDTKTEVDNARKILDLFNNEGGKLFRWCISNRLQESLEPN